MCIEFDTMIANSGQKQVNLYPAFSHLQLEIRYTKGFADIPFLSVSCRFILHRAVPVAAVKGYMRKAPGRVLPFRSKQ